MNIRIFLRAGLCAALIALAAPAGAAIWPPPDLAPLTNACRGHTGIGDMVAATLAGATVDAFCGCVATKLMDLPQADKDLLTRDLLETSTEAERAAHPNYAALSQTAAGALDACLVPGAIEASTAISEPVEAPVPAVEPALLPEPTPPAAETPVETETATAPAVAPVPLARPATPAPVPAAETGRLSAEAGGFLSACASSPQFRGYLAEVASGNMTVQGTVCACMTGQLVAEVAPVDLTILALDFGDPAAKDGVTPPANYEELAAIGQDSLRACMRESGVEPNF